jgi:hypothetical protein
MSITLNGSGTVSGISAGGLPDGIIQSADLASGVGGKILQVKQAVKTDTATISSGTFADVSGLSVSITPTSTSNKILVSCNTYVSGTVNSFIGFKILRDSTAIGLGTGASGNRTNVSMATTNLNATSSAYGLVNASFEFLDTPSSTSSLTYKLQWSSVLGNYVVYLNRPLVVTENRAMEMYTSSQITVKEVAA